MINSDNKRPCIAMKVKQVIAVKTVAMLCKFFIEIIETCSKIQIST